MLRAYPWLLVMFAGGSILPTGTVLAQTDTPRPSANLPAPHPGTWPYAYPPLQVFVNGRDAPAGNSFTSNGYGSGLYFNQGSGFFAEARAHIRVFLPDEQAQVTVNGRPTLQTGASRLFETPPLLVGKTHVYHVTATWNVHGRPVTQERRVVVVPGQYAVANFVVPAHTELISAP